MANVTSCHVANVASCHVANFASCHVANVASCHVANVARFLPPFPELDDGPGQLPGSAVLRVVHPHPGLVHLPGLAPQLNPTPHCI